jgi:hypothetical protein
LTYNYVEMGKDVYLKGRSNGMTEQAKEVRTRKRARKNGTDSPATL